MKKIATLIIVFCVIVTLSTQNPIEDSASFETLEIPDDDSSPARKHISEESVETKSFGQPKEDHMTIISFIEKVLSTAQHQSEMAVKRAKKRAELSKAIQEDAEKLIREAEEAKKEIELARRNGLHKRTKRVDSLESF